MSIIPILLDARPAYLGVRDAQSLLLLPTGTGVLLDELAATTMSVTGQPPLVVPRCVTGPAYASAIRAVRSDVEVIPACALRDPLARWEPSDHLLLVGPECYPAAGLMLDELLVGPNPDARTVRHLLALEGGGGGGGGAASTKEYVHADAGGQVRRIQRYFDPVTWPFSAGVVASLVPVACLLVTTGLSWDALVTLRMAMSARGVPTQDVPCADGVVHLDDEAGALALAESRVAHASAAGAGIRLGRGARVHPSARLLGPVVCGEGAEVEAGALIIGPTLLGAGARVGHGAVVAQCLVAADAVVPNDATLRHRVVVAPPVDAAGAAEGDMAWAPEPATVLQRRHVHAVTPSTPMPVAPNGAYHQLKSIVEPVLALVALVLLAPLFAVILLLLAVTSPGSPFYGDTREGRGGRPFRCWKFRSMRIDADVRQRQLAAVQEMDGPQFKMSADPRVTPIGRWLRRLNLDELPQLYNIVLGQMSFVGPRPSPFRENQICVTWRRGRLSVAPGLTGLWQVCRHQRELGDFHQWIHYDLLYVRHASLAVDVRILLATLLTLGGRWPVPVHQLLGHVAPRGPVQAEPPTAPSPLPTALPARTRRVLRARRRRRAAA